MPLFSYFQKRKRSSTKCTSPPPPYAECDPALPEQVPVTENSIKATDIPQWIWTNAQCREWLFAVCSESLGLGVEESKAISEKFEGYGPNIYCLKFEDWLNILGSNPMGRAYSVYSTLLSIRHEKGAVPKNVVLNHGYENKDKIGAGS
jgi:hypothetical protein